MSSMREGITPVRLAVVLNGLILIILSLAVSGQIYSNRQAVLERAKLQAEGLLNQHRQLILTHLETINLALYRLRVKLRLLEHQGDPHQVPEVLMNERDTLTVMDELLYLNRDGKLLYSSEVVDVDSSRAYLCPPFQLPTQVTDYQINRWDEFTLEQACLSFYKALFVVVADSDRQGVLSYALVAVLDGRYLEGELTRELAAFGHRAAYQLITRDNQVLLGILTEPPFIRYRVDAVAIPSDEDGEDILLFRTIPGFPLQLQIRLDSEEILRQNWRGNSLFLLMGALLFQFVCIGASGYMVRMIRHHHNDIHQREQRFNLSLEYAQVGVWDWQIEHNRIIWSNQVAPMFGAAVMGEQLIDFLGWIHAEDRLPVQQALEESIRLNHDYDMTYRVPHADGPHWLRSKGSVVLNDRGKAVRLLGTIQDVTAQIKAQQGLAMSELRFRTAFSSTALGNLILDGAGTIQDLNPAVELLLGYTREELLGQKITQLLAPSSRSDYSHYIERSLQSPQEVGQSQGRELVGLRKNGDEFPIQIAVGRMEDEHGVRFIASMSDLTAIRSLEMQLRRSQKMEAIGQLVGGISHDFNNILGIAIGHIELHLKKMRRQESEPKEIERMTKVLDTLWRGSKLTRNLLNFSRKESQNEEQVGSLNDLITETYDLIHKSLTSAIEVRTLLTPELWPVKMNRGDFQDVLINMAINARDAMPEGGVLTIGTENCSLSAHEAVALGLTEGDFVRLTIADSGCGIPPTLLERVFEPFFTTKEKGKGTGLGLSMVYGFVQRSHGSIQIESEVGIGTAFSIYLPRALESAAAEGRTVTPLLETRLIEPVVVAAVRRQVLIVDDEPALVEVAQHYFCELGYQTQIALSGREALSLLEQQSVDLLFSDVVMPGGMNGCQLALAARRLHPQVAILLTSGYTHEEGVLAPLSSESDREFCHQLLMQRLPKPYNLPQLIRQMEQLEPTPPRGS